MRRLICVFVVRMFCHGEAENLQPTSPSSHVMSRNPRQPCKCLQQRPRDKTQTLLKIHSLTQQRKKRVNQGQIPVIRMYKLGQCVEMFEVIHDIHATCPEARTISSYVHVCIQHRWNTLASLSWIYMWITKYSSRYPLTIRYDRFILKWFK